MSANAEVQVVKVVPAPEACPVGANSQCAICFEQFNDGAEVVIMGCGGGHIFHGKCHREFAKHDVQHQLNTYAHTLYEAVRRAEGAEQCPNCRQISYCASVAAAKNYRNGKTAEEAIVI